ncbi:MAG: DEAD/DEAH box helicase [Cyclobacteriaceae bacterium]|nr:DEAD/DEAH box helicase [Cyclobacteriaceae bacterium]
MNSIKTKKRTSSSFSRKNGNTRFANKRSNSSKKAVSSIDPNMLIKKAVPSEQVVYVPVRTFDQMPIRPNLKANLARKGYKFPTQIQEETLEYLVAGRDMVGIANTGTGKTGSFLIPIIEQLLSTSQPFKSLVVVPTRELALQVEEEFETLAHGLGIFCASFIGGTSVSRDLGQLRKKNHVIIGTPGRLMDLADRGALRLQDISTLVLDEFDRMLDMGFINDIKKMVKAMTSRKQTMLFSATIDKTQKSLVSDLLRNPIEIKVSSGTAASDQVEQDIIRVPQGSDKFKLLLALIGKEEFDKVLLFAETKRMVDKISKQLNQSGIKADLIHGNKSQNYRNNALNRFKDGKVRVLVATDVAARGIDVSDVSHVINYQLPMTFDSYVHRIGRTGRAGKTGKAYTFVD